MSTADLSIVAMAVVSLTHIWTAHKHAMEIAPRLRVVSPPKAQQDKGQDSAGDLAKRRAA